MTSSALHFDQSWRLAAALCLGLLGLAPTAAALAQASPGATVTWSVSPSNGASVKPGGRLTLTLQGAVRDGWHVYGLKQAPNGPTPLRVTLEANEAASASGPAVGSPPTVAHDRAFNLDTPFYAKPFTVRIPVRLKPTLAAGPQAIPVSVRFQTCNGQICEPPKTVRLSAAVNVAAAR